MNTELTSSFFSWIRERHKIYRKRVVGDPGPWTIDPILASYKFTNPFRENDRVTIWMRENWTRPNEKMPLDIQIFNCCFFRMFGTIEFAQSHGYVYDWDPFRTKLIAEERLYQGKPVFTGAYIITNMGLKKPKQEVVVDMFLEPLWQAKGELAAVAEKQSLEAMHKRLGAFPGWGGGGFMAYEAVTDLNHTAVLRDATDRFTWANAGPGAKRGLNRLHERKLDGAIKPMVANAEMQGLLALAPHYLSDDFPLDAVDMRVIEHSLCEWDKYQRVLLKQGKPRSVYGYKTAKPITMGPIL